MNTVSLDNTFVIRTDDKYFEEALIEFLTRRCDEVCVNAAYFHLNSKGAKEIMGIING